jgi:branched-chain amino acid transport system substrate-binding protein
VTPRWNARRLPRLLLACAAVLAGLTGCTAASSSQTVSGKTLYIYVSAPASAGNDPQQQDILYAEKLAFNQLQGTVTAFKLSLVPVVAAKLSDNARSSIQNKSTIAYLGELAPGSSADSLGINNAQDVLQVSPTDTAAELTQGTPAIKGAPQRYYESLSTYGRTFARVVPTTAVEAQLVTKEMQSLGVKNLYVTGDGSEYGRTLAQAMTADAPSASITVAQSGAGADAVFYAGSSQSGASSALSGAVAGNPKTKLFVPSALAQQSFAAQLPPAAQRNLYVSSPGILPRSLNQAARKFQADFRSTYGHAPNGEAVYGYAAMASVINVVAQSGASANNRSTVAHKFLAIQNLDSVVGPFSIDANGDTNNRQFVFSRVKAGKLVPFKAG